MPTSYGPPYPPAVDNTVVGISPLTTSQADNSVLNPYGFTPGALIPSPLFSVARTLNGFAVVMNGDTVASPDRYNLFAFSTMKEVIDFLVSRLAADKLTEKSTVKF